MFNLFLPHICVYRLPLLHFFSLLLLLFNLFFLIFSFLLSFGSILWTMGIYSRCLVPFSELGRMVSQLRIVSPAVVNDAQGRLAWADVAADLLLLLLLLLRMAEDCRLDLMLLLLQLLQVLSKLRSVVHRAGPIVHHVRVMLMAMDMIEIGVVRGRWRRVVLKTIGLHVTCTINNSFI